MQVPYEADVLECVYLLRGEIDFGAPRSLTPHKIEMLKSQRARSVPLHDESGTHPFILLQQQLSFYNTLSRTRKGPVFSGWG